MTLPSGEVVATGGNALLLGGAELRYDVGRRFSAAAFTEAGNVYPLVSDMTLGDLRYTAGLGLRYKSAFGPLRVDWGYKLDRRAGEKPLPRPLHDRACVLGRPPPSWPACSPRRGRRRATWSSGSWPWWTDGPCCSPRSRVLERLRGLDRKAAVDALIDERLMFREAARLPQAVVTPEEEERAYRELAVPGRLRGRGPPRRSCGGWRAGRPRS